MTRAESEAIQAAAWPKLRDIQSDKAAAPATFERSMGNGKRSEPSAPRGRRSPTSPFAPQSARLIALEEHNAQLLAAPPGKGAAPSNSIRGGRRATCAGSEVLRARGPGGMEFVGLIPVAGWMQSAPESSPPNF